MPSDHPDRRLECEFVMEIGFQQLAFKAEAAGWTEEEVAFALIGLAQSHIVTMRQNEMNENHLRSAKSRH